MRGAEPDVDALTPAWRALESRARIPLRSITGRRHYNGMVRFMENLLDAVGDDERHPLCGLLDVVTALVRDYEAHRAPIPDSGPAEALRWLMDVHALRRDDLATVFGAQSNVGEVLGGKPAIDARQARALAERFGVSAAVFL